MNRHLKELVLIKSGIGAGVAIGIATGIAAGRKKAHDAIYSYIISNNLTIQNENGEMIAAEDFLEEALVTGVEKNKAFVFLVIGLLVLLIIIGVVLFLSQSSG